MVQTTCKENKTTHLICLTWGNQIYLNTQNGTPNSINNQKDSVAAKILFKGLFTRNVFQPMSVIATISIVWMVAV